MIDDSDLTSKKLCELKASATETTEQLCAKIDELVGMYNEQVDRNQRLVDKLTYGKGRELVDIALHIEIMPTVSQGIDISVKDMDSLNPAGAAFDRVIPYTVGTQLYRDHYDYQTQKCWFSYLAACMIKAFTAKIMEKMANSYRYDDVKMFLDEFDKDFMNVSFGLGDTEEAHNDYISQKKFIRLRDKIEKGK